MAGGWPAGSDANLIFAQGAIMIAEALVFGLLASLVCPQPLLAAVVGIFLASMNPQVAMYFFVPSSHGFEARSMQAALPARLAFVALVGVVDGWLGLRWLPSNVSVPTKTQAWASRKVAGQAEPRRRWGAAFVRLVWQSVRQSWGVALAVTIIGVCLSGAYALVVGMFAGGNSSFGLIILLGVLFTPALLGAMVFRADQRREQYRFLAEHAGRPRTLWLARVLAWLTPMVLVVGSVCAAVVAYAFYRIVGGDADVWWWKYNAPFNSLAAGEVGAFELQSLHWRQEVLRVAGLLFTAAFTAFAYGQFFSIALRSEILAAMLALFTSMLIAGWVAVVGLGGLSAAWFFLPLGVGALAASWLRARDWMLERNGLARWSLPAIAMLLPVGFVLGLAPSARLAQVPEVSSVKVTTYDATYPLSSFISPSRATTQTWT